MPDLKFEMKILFVSSGNTPFSIVPFIKSQEESIASQGVDITHFVIYDNGIKGYYKAYRELRQHLKMHKYDLIHAHYSFCGWVARLSNFRIPIIISYMGSDVYGKVGENGKIKLTSLMEIISSQLLQPFVDRIIVKSQNLNKYIYLKKKSIVIPNGVNFDLYKPQSKESSRLKLNLPLNKKLVLFLGNPKDPRKNFQLLERAVSQQNSNDIALINPYPISPEKVPDYLNASDVLVLCSYKEGSPNVVKEAMALNRPVVATNVGDVAEIISNTKGCYISEFTPTDLLNNLKKALDFNGETTGREDIAHLEIITIAKKIIKLYEEVNQKRKKVSL
jgi:teichuronic acid biosynthesis glycosyltransferase TuaC